ncbi:MAG TPA: hypothetical protein VM261_18840 [Kofleriaceae bacterium]|nr:hypothetical protein [Kofleriaceae bacterium]
MIVAPGAARVAFAACAAGLIACAEPVPLPDGAVPLDAIVTAQKLTGAWEWVHFEIEAGTQRRERERWTFGPTSDRTKLVGRYTRDVLVRSLDSLPFECNQETRYRQRAEIFVEAVATATGVAIQEVSYRTDPGPCEHGLRELGAYTAVIDGDELHLAWPGGNATLARASDAPAPAPPETAPPPAGRWTWDVTSWTRSGMVRDEYEDWELAVGDDGLLGGTYVREVSESSPDRTDIPCAAAPSWGFVDRYVVRGRPMEDGGDGWRIEEVGFVAGQHPCLAATPRRVLDAATLTAEGEHVVVRWRGKRRQVLLRPGAE